MRPSRNVVVAAAVIALLAALALVATQLLSSSDNASGDLDRLVLTSSDLPRGYRQAERVTPAAGCSDPLFDRTETPRLRARGVVGCSILKYRRQQDAGDRVGLVYLRGYLFDDMRRASAALPQFRSDYVAGASGAPVVSKHSLPARALGDQAPRGVRLTLGGVGSPGASAFAYWWRRDKVVAVIAVADMFGDFDQRTVLALARRVDTRATR